LEVGNTAQIISSVHGPWARGAVAVTKEMKKNISRAAA